MRTLALLLGLALAACSASGTGLQAGPYVQGAGGYSAGQSDISHNDWLRH